MRKQIIRMAAIGWAFALAGCVPMTMLGGGKLEDADLAVYPVRTVDADLSSGIDAFRTIVAPLVSKSQCNSCHTTQAPTFASANLEVSYEAALSRLNKTTPGASALVTKSQDGHCGDCSSAPRTEWNAALEQWARVELAFGGNGGGGNGGGGGGPAEPPVDLGAPPVFVTAVQQLNGASQNNRAISLAAHGAAFNGVSLLVNVQDPYPFVQNTGRLFQLRLQNNSANYILVRGIRVFQSQDASVDPTDPQDYKPDVGGAFSDVDLVVYPNSTTQLSFGEALMSKSDGLYYVLGFQTLEVTNAATCKSLALYTATVDPIVNAGNCRGCHLAGGSGAIRWTLGNSAEARCLQTLQRSDLNTPIASRVIQAPRFRIPTHPQQSINDAQVDTIINWITQER